jgi:tetratricopeptide (TPR) repeat protein
MIQLVEVADRAPAYDLAQRCETALDAGGEILRAWQDFAEPYDSDAASLFSAPRPVNHSNTSDAPPLVPDMMAPPVPGPAGEAIPVAIGTEIPADELAGNTYRGDKIIIPCRTGDGRIIWVSVPRRAFLLGGIASIGAAATGAHLPGNPEIAPAARTFYSADDSPLERWQQIRRLLAESDNLLGPNHVIPATYEQLSIMSRVGSKMRGADRVQLFKLQVEFADLLAWLYQDSRNYRDAQYWLDRALDWSYAGGDTDITAIVLARKSELASDMGESADAIGVAEAAVRCAKPDAPAIAIAATYAAHGYALHGDQKDCKQAYDRAHRLLETMVDDDPMAWYGQFIDKTKVEAWRARSLSALGSYQQSAELFEAVLGTWPSAWRRGRGVHLARKAFAYAGAGDVDQAVAVGMQSLAIGSETGSGRIVNELFRLDGALTHWRSAPGVTEFRAAMNDVRPSVPTSGSPSAEDRAAGPG